MDVKHSLHFQQSHRPAKTQPVRWLFVTHDLECEKAGVISKRGVPSLAPGFYGAGSIPAGTQLWNQSLVFMPLCSRQQRGRSTLFSRRAFDSKKQRECAINPETAASRNHPGAAGFLFPPQHRGSAAGRLTSRRRRGFIPCTGSLCPGHPDDMVFCIRLKSKRLTACAQAVSLLICFLPGSPQPPVTIRVSSPKESIL